MCIFHPTCLSSYCTIQVAEKTARARIVTKAEVYKLVQNGRSVVGCEYRKAGKSVKDRETYQDTGHGNPSFHRHVCPHCFAVSAMTFPSKYGGTMTNPLLRVDAAYKWKNSNKRSVQLIITVFMFTKVIQIHTTLYMIYVYIYNYIYMYIYIYIWTLTFWPTGQIVTPSPMFD